MTKHKISGLLRAHRLNILLLAIVFIVAVLPIGSAVTRTSSLTENFNDGSINSTLWIQNYSGTVTGMGWNETTSNLRLSTVTAAGASYDAFIFLQGKKIFVPVYNNSKAINLTARLWINSARSACFINVRDINNVTNYISYGVMTEPGRGVTISNNATNPFINTWYREGNATTPVGLQNKWYNISIYIKNGISNLVVYNDSGLVNQSSINSSILNGKDLTFDVGAVSRAAGGEVPDCNITGLVMQNYVDEAAWVDNGQTFINSTSETFNNSFSINLTYDTSRFTGVVANLMYNNTRYIGSNLGSGSNALFTAYAISPVITTLTNIPFYWEVGLINSTGINYYNSTSNSQEVSKLWLVACNSTYTSKTLNFTAYDEQNLSRIIPFSFKGTFNYGTTTTKLGYSSVNTPSATEQNICLFPVQSIFYTDAIIEYSYNNENITYSPRNYYFQSALVNNALQNISLYLLDATDSTSFIIKVQDQKLSAVTDALVLIQRYYPEDGIYRTVQIAKTDDNGESIGFYEVETADYKHIIMKDGVILLETAAQKVVGKEAPYTLTFTTGSALGYPWSPWIDNPNIQQSLTFNKTSNITTFTYIDSTGLTAIGRLKVVQEKGNNATLITVCDTSSSSSSATITCDATGYTGSFIAYGYIDSNVSVMINFNISTAADTFGLEGVFIAMLMIMVAGFAFLWNPTAGIIGINAAVIFTNLMGFITFSPVFIFGLIAVSIITILLLKT